MSLYLTGGVAVAYAAGVVGLHRWAVFRRRQAAQGFPTLAWRDWDTLLEGVAPAFTGPPAKSPPPPEGGPAPRALLRGPAPDTDARQYELLCALVAGASVEASAWETAGFSGGEARWLALLGRLRREPEALLAQLEATPAESVGEAYLQQTLALELRVTPLNLELMVFSAKRRIGGWLGRFGEHPALFFARARASALLGFSAQVLDDLARAVYFSREAPFYLHAVTGLAFVEEARPALAHACRQGLARQGETP